MKPVAFYPNRRQTRRGSALIMGIVLSVVITGMVLGLAWAATIQSNGTSAMIKTDGTFYAAEYAMQDTLWRYKKDNTYRASASAPRTMNLVMNGNTYNCSVTCQDAVGFPTIEWKFDEGSGTTTLDASGNNNTGTLNNCAWTTSARQGSSALYFNGTNSYVNCGSSPSTNLTGNVTMAAWVKLGSASADQKIGGNENGTNGGYKFYIYNSKVVFEVRDALNNSNRNKNQPGGTVLAINTWYHVAGLYSETNHWIKTYVNGKEETSRRLPGLTADSLSVTTPSFIIGREPFDTLYYFNGIIDDVRVYNSELTDAAILALYNTSVDVHATATLAGTQNTASAALTTSVPLPPAPTLPEITANQSLTLKNCTISGDVQVNGDLTGSTTASTIDGSITYASHYYPSGFITQLNPSTHTLASGTVTVQFPDTATITSSAQQVYSSSQNGTTFQFTNLGGNKVIVVNGDVTNPQFDLTSGVFPSGGTLMINGNLILSSASTIGNSTNGVYVIVTGNCTAVPTITVTSAVSSSVTPRRRVARLKFDL